MLQKCTPMMTTSSPLSIWYVSLDIKSLLQAQQANHLSLCFLSLSPLSLFCNWQTLEPVHSPTSEATHDPNNVVKNRYANITACEFCLCSSG